MADVTGPISTLPGAERTSPDGMTCDYHPDRVAYRRVQGETDSFGCEMIDMCRECYDAYKAEQQTADRSGTCDWCKTHQTDLRPHRDFEEGSAGRVYDVCGKCVKKERAALDAEWEEEMNNHLNYGDWD